MMMKTNKIEGIEEEFDISDEILAILPVTLVIRSLVIENNFTKFI